MSSKLQEDQVTKKKVKYGQVEPKGKRLEFQMIVKALKFSMSRNSLHPKFFDVYEEGLLMDFQKKHSDHFYMNSNHFNRSHLLILHFLGIIVS